MVWPDSVHPVRPPRVEQVPSLSSMLQRILALHRAFFTRLKEGFRPVLQVDSTLHNPLFLARKAGFRRFLSVFHNLSPPRSAKLVQYARKQAQTRRF